jgi:predicted TIM-barrel fold metal-dependent hydrolase
MKIIDAHLHFSNIQSFKRTAAEISNLDYSSEGLKKEFADCGIVTGIAMGLSERSEGAFPDFSVPNPMMLDLEKDIPQQLMYSIGINPVKLCGQEKEKELSRIEKELINPKVAGIKIYAGYYHYHVYDNVYQDIYELASKYKLPVTIHCGDTYSERGLLKYSHPLNVDELAVAHRDVNFIIAHIGDPWVMDTVEIIRKNPNVYADLSGLIVGDKKEIKRYGDKKLFVEHIKRSFVYADNYYKLLFGSDWPLVQIKPYIEFIKGLIPEEFHEDVFYKNALRVFTRIESEK